MKTKWFQEELKDLMRELCDYCLEPKDMHQASHKSSLKSNQTA